MTGLQLDHLNLSVNSFDATAEWYHRVFDFEVVEEDVLEEGNVRWGVIRGGDASLCIYEHPEYKFETKDARMKRGVHSLSHFGLRIDDREAWEARLKREKIKVLYGGPVRWPHSNAWYIEDPTGYEIEVVLWDEGKIEFGN